MQPDTFNGFPSGPSTSRDKATSITFAPQTIDVCGPLDNLSKEPVANLVNLHVTRAPNIAAPSGALYTSTRARMPTARSLSATGPTSELCTGNTNCAVARNGIGASESGVAIGKQTKNNA